MTKTVKEKLKKTEQKLEILAVHQPILIRNSERLTNGFRFSVQMASYCGSNGFYTGKTVIRINIEDKVGFIIDQKTGKGMMYKLLNPIRPGQRIKFHANSDEIYLGYDEVLGAIESMPRTIRNYLKDYLVENFERK